MQRLETQIFWMSIWICVTGLSLWIGKDLNWDFINYHFYAPYLLLEHRIDQDYFAGSFQSYLNPLVYVPHYLMIRSGWNSVLIAVLLSTFHALNLAFVWLIAKQILPEDARNSRLLPMLAVLLAMLAPLFITTIGSSFADPTTSVLVLAGVWLLLGEATGTLWRVGRLFASGVLLGIASGLKMTNGVLLVAISLPAVAYWLLANVSGRWSRVAVLIGSVVLGFVLAHGYWSWQLWRTFGNPLFPLFNNVFHSPDFPPVTYRDTRFLGSGWLGLLSLPFEMMLPISWLYAENTVVDLRPAALLLLLAAGGAFALRRRIATAISPAPTAFPRQLILLSAMVALAYVAWGMSTRIGRYAVPLWLLLGPMIVAWECVLIRRRDIVVVLGLVLVAAQAYVLVLAGNPRWTPTEWERVWLDVRVPEDLSRNPVTLLTVGKLSYSAIVPFLHPDSAVANIVGQHVQPAGSAMTARLERLLSAPPQTLRVAFRDNLPSKPYDAELRTSTREDMNAVLSVYSLRLAASSCEPIIVSVPHLPGDDSSMAGSIKSQKKVVQDRLHVCRVERLDAAEHAKVLAERESVSRAFDAIEAACAGQLSPRGGEVLHGRLGWLRDYFNSLQTLITDGEVVYVRPFHSMVDVDLGRLQDWTKSPTPPCPRLPAAINRP